MNKENLDNIKFIIKLILITIAIWWWFTQLTTYPIFIPFLIGTIMSIKLVHFNLSNSSGHSVGDGIGILFTTFLFCIYAIGLMVSIYIYKFS